MNVLWAVTAVALTASLVADRQRTRKALVLAARKLLRLLPAFLLMLTAVSLALGFLPETVLLRLVGRGHGWLGAGAAALAGSVTMMPGFVAFPLAGILLEKGASYTVLSAFTTTLMMVGILTFPVEREYLGTRVAVARNVIGLLTAIAVALAVALFYGEAWA